MTAHAGNKKHLPKLSGCFQNKNELYPIMPFATLLRRAFLFKKYETTMNKMAENCTVILY
jgi:hypothetical protein